MDSHILERLSKVGPVMGLNGSPEVSAIRRTAESAALLVPNPCFHDVLSHRLNIMCRLGAAPANLLT